MQHGILGTRAPRPKGKLHANVQKLVGIRIKDTGERTDLLTVVSLAGNFVSYQAHECATAAQITTTLHSLTWLGNLIYQLSTLKTHHLSSILPFWTISCLFLTLIGISPIHSWAQHDKQTTSTKRTMVAIINIVLWSYSRLWLLIYWSYVNISVSVG